MRSSTVCDSVRYCPVMDPILRDVRCVNRFENVKIQSPEWLLSLPRFKLPRCVLLVETEEYQIGLIKYNGAIAIDQASLESMKFPWTLEASTVIKKSMSINCVALHIRNRIHLKNAKKVKTLAS